MWFNRNKFEGGVMEIRQSHRAIFLFSLFLITALTAAAQSTDGMGPDDIVDKAAERSRAYLETFKNLLSEESKTFEIYQKNGEIKKRRKVESTFLVYQLTKGGLVAEFRNVIVVDGKQLGNTDERARDFFEKVTASESSQKELDRISEESTRYDPDFAINGLTLFQAAALTNDLRPSFKFNIVGRETLNGLDTILLSFEQTAPNRSITINGQGSNNYDIEIDGTANDLNPRIRGKIWLDPATFNIRREVRERTIQPNGYDQPVVVAEDEFDYIDSEFDILTPRKISHVQYVVKLKEREVRKDMTVEFVYGKFTRPDVEVKSSEVRSN